MGVTVRVGRGKIAVVSLAAVIAVAVTACNSGDSGGSENSSPAPSADGVSSVPVPAGVAKDSVLDLNSTKDMTGVVTTVPIGQSPYDENMPDICPLIPQSVVNQLGMASKKKAFFGRKLVTQTCSLAAPPPISNDRQILATIYVNNIKEFRSVGNFEVQEEDLLVGPGVKGIVFRKRPLDFYPNPTGCQVAWGTFYGVAVVSASNFSSDENVCPRAKAAALALLPYFPRSPSEMRPTS